jgi:hypothetical protein
MKLKHAAGAAWLGVLAVAAAGGAGVRAKGRVKVDPCASAGPAPGPGSLDPFRPPAPKALELNAAGKVPYRVGKWDEARAQYRAAEAADAEFLAPKLNIACSFVRQERFAEATAEVVALLDRAYVPWAKEILDAADLGALKVRPEMQEIQRAMAASAARWGDGLDTSVLFVARQRPPLRVPDGPGIFILNPHQEAWAYSPRTQRYRQLTAEDGHVVALARSPDGRRIAYVTAEKLVRGARPSELALRGVTIHQLALGTMAQEGAARAPEDVRRLDLFFRESTFLFRIVTEHTSSLRRLAPGDTLTPVPERRALERPLVVLSAAGVKPVPEGRPGDGCALPAVALKSSSGVGRAGLPIP